MQLVSYKNPVLKTPCRPWDFNSRAGDPFPATFAKDLIAMMVHNKGIGLAANQVGSTMRAFAMQGPKGNICCFNPRIIDSSMDTEDFVEGCLSYPSLYVKINRPKAINVEYQTFEGETVTTEFTGLPARIFQHEQDHLLGLTMKVRCSPLVLKMAIKKANKHYNTDYTTLDL